MQFFHSLIFLVGFLGITTAEEYNIKKSIELVEKVLAFAKSKSQPTSAEDFFRQFQEAVTDKGTQELADATSKFGFDDDIWQKVSSVHSSPFLQPENAKYTFGDTPAKDVRKLLKLVKELKSLRETSSSRFVELDAEQQAKMKGWAFWTKVTVWVGCGIAAPFTGGASLAAAPLINMGISAVDVGVNVAQGNNAKAAVGVVSIVAGVIPGGGVATDALAESADLAVDVASDAIGDIAGDSAGDVAQEVGQGIAKEVAGEVQGHYLEKGAKALGLKNKGDRPRLMETGVSVGAAFTAVAPSTAKLMKRVAKKIRKQRQENECYFKFNPMKIRKSTGKLPANLDKLKAILLKEQKEVETYTRMYQDVYLPTKERDVDEANALMDTIYLKGFSQCKAVLSSIAVRAQPKAVEKAKESKRKYEKRQQSLRAVESD